MLVEEVWRRAGGACEYCQMHQSFYSSPFQIDHIIARKHGGLATLENLALSCLHCNIHKGPNIAGIDTVSRETVRLFHPRLDKWTDHFEWDGPLLVGRTPIGRVTIHILAINDAEYREVRAALISEGVFPPSRI